MRYPVVAARGKSVEISVPSIKSFLSVDVPLGELRGFYPDGAFMTGSLCVEIFMNLFFFRIGGFGAIF